MWILTLVATAAAQQAVPAKMSIKEAVDLAVEQNPTVKEARANLKVAEYTVKSELADLLPQLSLGYGYTELKETPIRKTESGIMQVAHQYQYGWDVTVVQPLFAGFALHSKFKIAELDQVAKELETDQAALDIALATRAACYNFLLARKLFMVSEHEVTTLKAHKRDAELFYREGLISPNDQLKAEVALANALQARQKAEAEVKKANLTIKQLLGIGLDQDIDITDNTNVTSSVYDLDNLSYRALGDQPILKLLDIGLEKLGYSQKIANSDWYPQVSLVGSYTKSGKDTWAETNDFSNNDESFIAVQAKWNIFNGGKTIAKANATKRQLEALEATIEQYRSQVLKDVRSAVLDCEVAYQNVQTAEKALDQARENYRITNLQYQQQAATSTDVLDASNFLTQADTNYYQAVYGYLSASAALDRAIAKKP